MPPAPQSRAAFLSNYIARIHTRKFVFAYHVWLFLNLAVMSVILVRRGREWGYGDWLINYEGGFVRRGFMGETYLLLARVLHTNLLYLVAITAVICYVATFYSVWRMLTHSSWRWWVVLLLISPATLAFPVMSRSGFRKEILFLAILALLLDRLRRVPNKPRGDLILAACLSVGCPVLVLTHEPLAVYMPYLAAALLIALRKPQRVIRILLCPALLSAIAMVMVLRHTGDVEVVKKICASLGDPSLDTCAGPVQFLAWTKQYAAYRVTSYISGSHYYRNYGIILVLALIPVAAAFRDLWQKPKAKQPLLILACTICFASLASISLFIYGFDWGRWIYIHMLSIAMLLLFIDRKMPGDNKNEVSQVGSGQVPHLAMSLFFIAYALCWSMPGFGDTPRFGYLSLATRALHALEHRYARGPVPTASAKGKLLDRLTFITYASRVSIATLSPGPSHAKCQVSVGCVGLVNAPAAISGVFQIGIPA